MMMRSLLVIATLATACLSVGVTKAYDMGPYEGFYQDVSIGHWAVNAIEAMTWEGIMKGPRPGVFEPDRAVNRAEMAVVAARLDDKLKALEARVVVLEARLVQAEQQ
jgi:hypothetical protein